MNVIYETEATASGGRHGSVRAGDGVLEVTLALPKEMGGPGGAGTNPEQLFAAGYAACFSSALMAAARAAKVTISSPTVTARVGIGRMEDGRFRLRVELLAELPGVPPEQAHSLVQEAHRIYPYSNATRGDAEVSVELVPQQADRQVA